MVSKTERAERKRLMMKKRIKEKQIARDNLEKKEPSDTDEEDSFIELKKTEDIEPKSNNWEIQDFLLLAIFVTVIVIFLLVAFYGLKTE